MENDSNLRKSIYNQILSIKDAKGLYDLFRILGFPKDSILDVTSRRKKSTFELKKEDSEKIKEIYSLLNLQDNLQVFLLETTTLAPSFIKSVANTFDKQYLQYLLIFSINYSEVTFLFPDKERIEAGKNKLKLIKLNINREDIKTKNDYYSVIETISNLRYENSATWREVWRNWKAAFSVERVTEKFFDDYKEVFFKLRRELQKQGISSKESHEFTLQFLNRIMFIYFISKKKWLEEQKFVYWLWSSYRKQDKLYSNEFYEKWLKEVFLKAFNNRANEIKGLPDEVVRVISNAPYLNGGLFRENNLDQLKVTITDKMIQKTIDFFESYNFTIKEDMPLESEVAVDPQMIGYVYESLANVAEEIYDRNDLGIFYTPRVEVDFMCRRSLVEYLSKNLPELPKEKFYHLIFDLAEERERIEEWFTKNEHWRKLEDTLNNLSVVDPACGSGAFLVGMLNVVSDLYRMIYKHMGNSLSDFALKNRVIQYSLYGVDVMPWAIHAAELRLWLQLIVETDFKKEELRQHPLLPNLNLNLRIGDTLVQEIGGISFNLRTNNLKDHLKRKLEDLKQEKRKYFENSPTAKFKSPEEVKEEEIRLFEEIIDERIESLAINIQDFEHNIKGAMSQKNLVWEQVIDEMKIKENQLRIEFNKEEIEKLRNVRNHLNDPVKKPFVWDIDFAEIFGDKGGFDIVIGNPPYVKYQKISPPNKVKEEVSLESKREYKDKLVKSVMDLYPGSINKVYKNSDYYVFFYFHGLSLLNRLGTFCFITSNSWLDVEYGRPLQEFLLKNVPIIAIYDNIAKKSFEHADVNTVISLFEAPRFSTEGLEVRLDDNSRDHSTIVLDHDAKFITFKRPFESAINTENLLKIEDSGKFASSFDFRIFSSKQSQLYRDGKRERKDYNGTMWGARYLRSPDIFLDIWSKSGNKLVKLGDFANIETYLNTLGSDDFFFVTLEGVENNLCKIRTRIDGSIFYIEPKFLTDFIESPRELKSILITGQFKTKLFRLPKQISDIELRNYNANEYVKFGRRKGFRTKLPKQAYQGGAIIMACYQGASHMVNYNPSGIISHRFFRIIPKNQSVDNEMIALILNSSFCFLSMEIFRNPSLGGGVLAHGTYTMREFALPNINSIFVDMSKFKGFMAREVKPVSEELGIDMSKPIREQEPKPLPDRAELDSIIFDELGLTQDERKEVYWSVCELVKQRIDKARSLRD
jgi:hypothetical protein